MIGTAPAFQSEGPLKAHWSGRFRLRHKTKEMSFQPVPPRVLTATRNAWDALARGGPDQVVPGLHPIGLALIVRNLLLTLPERPPLIVLVSDKEAIRAYHRLESKILGRWASKYPMFYRGEDGEPVAISRRGLSRNNPPRPLLYRALTVEDVAHWRARAPDANVLVLANDVEDVPPERPDRCHVILTGIFSREREALQRVRRPCKLVAPERAWEVTSETTIPEVRAFQAAERNLANLRVRIESVASDEAELARLQDSFRHLARSSWKQHPAFVSICHQVLARLSSDMFVDVPDPSADHRPTEALVAVLRGMVRLGEAPQVPEARLFVGEAHMTLEARKAMAPRKATWFQERVRRATTDLPDIIVDSEYTASRGRKELASAQHNFPRYVRVQPFTSLKEPKDVPAILAMAPNARLLHALAVGAVPSATILLYPWEHVSYNSARRYLDWCAKQLGIRWPALPEAPEVEASVEHPEIPMLVARPRTHVDFESLEDIAPDGPVDEVLVIRDDGPRKPHVSIETTAGHHDFPAERTVVVLRAKHFHEVLATNVLPGDILVNYKGGAAPSAAEVVARVCRRNERMDRTRALASTWRKLLNDYVQRNLPDATIAEVHRRLNPGVEYFQFRNWISEGEPVTPARKNLVRLMNTIGYDQKLAEAVYAAGLDHKADRRAILQHILDLSESRLDKLYRQVDIDEVADDDYGISVEDLLAIIQFEKVTKVQSHAR